MMEMGDCEFDLDCLSWSMMAMPLDCHFDQWGHSQKQRKKETQRKKTKATLEGR